MSHKLVNVGFGNSVVSRRVVAIISPNAAPIKRFLSAIQSETIAQRFSPDVILSKEEIEE
ncbi:MAG: DUF370 domain-containing protein [Deltaproteobacteria bacterium]|nr:DUF370 domain-containing protein [Deltaproteobacteria bacterium]